ncbi:hypothetical protein TWF718_007374 [Orbilia javanica]|uniref:Nucleoside phosphorylase domain-containing protein n=1 Tax=Orbilia javanica TaxID=47235 RepID=A0AAN8MY48_9PEZI
MPPDRNTSKDTQANIANPKPRSPDEYTVGWICALPKEQTAARALLDEIHPDPIPPLPPKDENEYILGSMGEHNIAITCLPKGKVGTSEAAVAATEMMRTFPSIRIGFMVGIGGGVPPKVRLGDVVVGTPTGVHPGVIQWDFGKEEADGSFKRTGAMSNPPRVLLKALTRLETIHDSEGTQIPEHLDSLKKKWPRLVPKYTWTESLKDPLCAPDTHQNWVVWFLSLFWFGLGWLIQRKHSDSDNASITTPERQPGEVRVHYGLIASGNKVIKNANERDTINESLGGNILCVEMEAAGIVNFPCLVVRGICDYADARKNDEWQEYAAAVAAAFTKELLEHTRPGDVEVERPMKEILDQLKVVSENIATMNSKLDKKEDLEILDWLTPIEFGEQQTDYFNIRQPETGQWLLSSTEYKDWVETKKKTLFCPGMPGAGKTILTSVVLDNLTSRFSNHPEIGIAYIYCNFRRKGEQTAQNLLASLLKQLSRSRSTLPVALKNLHDHHKNKGSQTRPSVEEIAKALEVVTKQYERVFIVVDALDECQISDNCREIFLSMLFQLCAVSDANIFATSRNIPHITERFKGSLRIEIRAHDGDVRRFLDAQITASNEDILINNRDEVTAEIVKVVDGMFLLARLHFETIRQETTLKDVRKALQIFQAGKNATDQNVYDSAYDEAMKRITDQNPKWKNLALRVLSWITLATEPFTTLKLQHALAVEPGQPELDNENFTEITKMVSVCAGLVTTDEESDIIRLVHYTTQEYFERTWERWFPEAQADITETCITYLSYSIFQCLCTTEYSLGERQRLNILYNYATKNLGHHARQSSNRVIPLLLNFLEKWDAVLAWVQLFGYNTEYGKDHRRYSQVTAAHVAVYLGLPEIMVHILARGVDIEATDEDNRTPLLLAAEIGCEEVTKLLIDAGAKLETTDDDSRTPLLLAAVYNRKETAKLLIDAGANIEATDEDGCTPLSLAAAQDSKETAKLLIDAGANTKATSGYRRTPLLLAAVYNRKETAKLLIDAGANIEATDEDGFTPLLLAAVYNHKEVAGLLIDAGANIEAKGRRGLTPLLWAAMWNRKGIARLLIDAGANIEVTDEDSRTPLLLAANDDCEEIARLLINAGANIEATDKDSWTPLLLASKAGHEGITKLLLGTGAAVDASVLSENGYTALLWAVEGNHEGIVKLLIENGADIYVKDHKGRGSLELAETTMKNYIDPRRNYREEIPRLLRAKFQMDIELGKPAPEWYCNWESRAEPGSEAGSE